MVGIDKNHAEFPKFVENENNFLSTPDSFGIYQVKNGEEFLGKRFTNIKHLEKAGEEVEKESYDFVYFAPLDTLQTNDFENKNSLLNQVFYIFNTDLPERYQGRSVSVSDVIALNQGGEVSCHFVDSFGFQEVKNFINSQAHAVSKENKSEQSIMKDILKSLVKENERKQQGTHKKNLHDER